MKFIDVPKYRIRPVPGRFLVDRLLALLAGGIILYLFIYVNYYLLSTTIPGLWNILILVVLVLLIVLQLIACYVRYGNYVYDFYDQKIVINDNKVRSIPYSEIKSTSYSNNLFDKWFKTGSIILELKSGHKIKLRYLSNPNQAYVLMQKR